MVESKKSTFGECDFVGFVQKLQHISLVTFEKGLVCLLFVQQGLAVFITGCFALLT